MKAATVLALVVLLMGCAAAQSPSPASPLGPGEHWLPVVDDRGGQVLCAGVGFVGTFRLHGSATDPRLVWMTRPDGSRADLVWPVGYRARFDPTLEVLDADGSAVAAEGSVVSGGCPIGGAGEWLVDFVRPQSPGTTPGPHVMSGPA